MSWVDVPLEMFIGGKCDLIERLYSGPDMNNPEHLTSERDDYKKIMELPTVENYNPTRVDKPSYIYCDQLAPIFGSSQICIYSEEYKFFEHLKNEIMYVVEKSSGVGFTILNQDFIAFPDNINEFLVELFVFNKCSWKDLVLWDDAKNTDTVLDWRDRCITESKQQIDESSAL